MITRNAPTALVNSVLAWCPEVVRSLGLTIVAGGFIRAYFAGEKPSDMDLYFRNQECFLFFIKELQNSGWKEVANTDRAVTFLKDGKCVQAIRYRFGNPDEVIGMFDFTICQASMTVYNTASLDPEGIDPENGQGQGKIEGNLWLHENFFEHLAARVLVFNPKAPMPLASLKRVIKYLKRGYSICDEGLIVLAEAINRTVDFEDPESVQQAIAGMDPDGQRRIRVID